MEKNEKKSTTLEIKGVERRTLMKGLGCVGVTLALGPAALSLVPGEVKHSKLIRPPGGQVERRFSSLCVRCNRCQEACPRHVIATAHLGDGLLAARTPKLDFTLGYCDFCMKCVDVCPTNALARVDKKTTHIGIAVILKDQCIPWQWGGCTRCFEKCPEKAIRLDDQKRPYIDPAKCNGCGLCEQICPATELRSYQPGQTRGVEIVRLGSRIEA
ncbi:MAG: 4Fe-4S dicluster domain-containing protein [Acidobacteriota bacterium]|nr:4Fe-4S dicluster domain-containing protein [Acidobacteriota bacterium]